MKTYILQPTSANPKILYKKESKSKENIFFCGIKFREIKYI